jgi:hypothetical protein
MGSYSDVKIEIPKVHKEKMEHPTIVEDLDNLREYNVDLEITEDTNGFWSVSAPDIKWGAENKYIVNLLNSFREESIGYRVLDFGNQEWMPDITIWEPGMSEPVKFARDINGNVILCADDVLKELADYPDAAQKIREKFNLDLIGLEYHAAPGKSL